jgi:hypothetical protein
MAPGDERPMSDTGPELQFDKATYASGDAGGVVPCGQCKQPLGEQYWRLQTFLLCDRCKTGIQASLDKSQSASSFGKALLQGGLVALGCGIGYAIFVGVTSIQFALITIGIGYLVAKTVRKASGGLSGRKFQVLAVVLTYLASTMGYAPGIFNAIKDSGDKHQVAGAASGVAAAPSAPSAPVTATGEPGTSSASADPGANRPVGVGQLLLAIAMLIGIMLAAPFLEITEAPIGVLIVLFGLWEAWKLSKGVNVVIEGPFRVAPGTPGAPAA